MSKFYKKYILNYTLYLFYKLNRPLIFWPIRFGFDKVVLFLSIFYKNRLNISWPTYNLKPEGNFTEHGVVSEENNLIISIIKYCKLSTVDKLLSAHDVNIQYIDTNLSPLHFANINKNLKMVKVLKKYGANEESVSLKGKKPKDLWK